MEREDDPQLWDLLRHSKVPEPSPFFARNVLRAVRDAGTNEARSSWFSLRRLVPALSAVAALIIAVFALHPHGNRPVRTGNEIAAADVSDAELATDLDVLSGDDDSDDAPLL